MQLKESDFTNIKQVIQELLSDERYQVGRDKVRAEAWQKQGFAAANITDYLIQKVQRLKEN